MQELFTHYEPYIRLGAFLGIFILLALWERNAPRRKLLQLRRFRWFNNFGLVVISAILVRFIFPLAAAGVAHLAEQSQWGMLYIFEIPYWSRVILAFVLLDFSIYLQHVMFHSLPLMWRFHRVHHTDLDCDVTTGLRFHPFEILLSILIKFATIMALGAPVLAVVIFEIILNATSMFTHSNIRLPLGLDRVLRWFIVTPDMHRIHHSVLENETNSNFGFNIAIWDRLFGTYRQEPAEGHEAMKIGLDVFREPKWQNLRWLIYLPFAAEISGYAINRRRARRKQDNP